MVWNTTRTQFQDEMAKQRSAAFDSRYQLPYLQRQKQIQIAIHGRNFIQSIGELKNIVSESYNFSDQYWEDLVTSAMLAMRNPNEQTLGIFNARITDLVETLEQHGVSNTVTGIYNTVRGTAMTLGGFILAFTGFCLALAAGCFGGVILGIGIGVMGAITSALGMEETTENFRFTFGKQIKEITDFAAVVDPASPATVLMYPQPSQFQSGMTFYQPLPPQYVPSDRGSAPLYPQESSQFPPTYVPSTYSPFK